MTKNDFLVKLAEELTKNKITDADEIVGEYEQHFTCKMADGFSEEEIAAKLGSPAQLAAQFERNAEDKPRKGNYILTAVGLGFIDFFAGIFLILLVTWGIIMAAFALTSGVTAFCLIFGLNIFSLLPQMPYGCAAVMGIAFAALTALVCVGSVYFVALLRQLLRAFSRFHHNALATAAGRATLPQLEINPRLAPKTNRRLRSIALISLVVFAAFIVLSMVVSMLSAGAFEFWHEWNWFGFKP